MSEMKLRIAEAIGCLDADRCTRMDARPSRRKPPCEKCMDAVQRVLDVMRTPTLELLNAAQESCPNRSWYNGVWVRMIDEAMK